VEIAFKGAGATEVSFFELMAELFGDLDIGIGSDVRRRIAVDVVVVHLGLEHDGLLPLEEMDVLASSGDTHIACQR
jgi:hypothetical protein